MIITFCGHSSFVETEEYKNKTLKILISITKDTPVEFYLGGYGGFDEFAYFCCNEYKKINKAYC